MRVLEFDDWQAFCDQLDQYAALEPLAREQWWFRGHADARWTLETKLDRQFRFRDDRDRAECYQELLDTFKTELLLITQGGLAALDGDGLELYARHQGLPTPHLDWTTSPYIAAFFAFAEAFAARSERVAVWGFNRAALPAERFDLVELIEDPELVRFNRRALRQRGVFMRIVSGEQPPAELLDPALVKFEIATDQARVALTHLDEMTVNSTFFFYDPESAAQTATTRVAVRR